jgi:predicted flap endonuclease-1-like 5' DNA nuclease/uncharacterized membrane-anchored protein YhcB (DUF1043 family)
MVGEVIEFVLALLVGFVLGWLLRPWWTRGAAAAETAKLRVEVNDREARLSSLGEDLNKHRTQVTSLTTEVETHRATIQAHEGTIADLESSLNEQRTVSASEVVALRQQLADSQQALAACQARTSQYEAQLTTLSEESKQSLAAAAAEPVAEVASVSDTPVGFASLDGAATTSADVAEGGRALGRSVKLDDLKVVEGIGPAIEKLCHAKAINTWRILESTPVTDLRTMLEDAGPRFRMHDPASWPQQAGLLADGRWAEFKALTDQLSGGRQR